MPVRGEEGQRHGRDTDGVPAVAEQAHIETRMVASVLHKQEQRDDGDARDYRTENHRIDPRAGFRCVDDSVHQQDQPDDRQHEPEHVQLSPVGVSRFRNNPPDSEQSDGHDRHVDQEDRSPGVSGQWCEPLGVLQQCSTQNRPEGHGRSHGARPGADRSSSLVRGKDDRDDRQRRRQHSSAADAHHRPEPDQHLRRRGEGAGCGGQTEHDQTHDEDALASIPIAEHSPGEQQSCKHQDVGIHRPHQLALGRFQFALDSWQRDIQNRVVENDDEQADDENAEDRPTPGVSLARDHPAIGVFGRGLHAASDRARWAPPQGVHE